MELPEDLKNKLCNVDNNHCIIAEFVNEFDEQGKPFIQTGFAAWVIEEDDLDFVINTEKEILVYWPDCDIVSAGLLKKKLRQCCFKKHCVKIKAQGEWTDMRKKTNNLISFDEISPTKENRKVLKKKVQENVKESNPPVKRIKSMNKNVNDVNELIINTMESNLSKISYEGDDVDPLQMNAMNENDMKDTDDDEEEEEEDNDGEEEEEQEQEEDEMINLMNEKDEELKMKVDEIKKLCNKVRNLEEELQRKNNIIKELNEKVYKHEKLQSSYKTNAAQHERFVQTVYKDVMAMKNAINKTVENIHASSSVPLKEISNSYEDKDDASSSSKKFKAPTHSKTLDSDENYFSMAELPDTVEPLNEHQISQTSQGEVVPQLKKSKKKKIIYGQEQTSYIITDEVKNRLPRKQLKDFSNAILDILFTKKELACSCVTGIPSNARQGQAVRPALNRDKMAAARNLCYEWFGQKQKNWKSVFHYIAKNKCGDARKLFQLDEQDEQLLEPAE